MNRLLPALAALAVLLPAEMALLPHLTAASGWFTPGFRADLPLCALVYLAIAADSTLEGAVGCFATGVVADGVYRVQPGLFLLSSLLLFLAFRLGPFGRELRRPLAFAANLALAVPLQSAVVQALLWAIGRRPPDGFWSATAAGTVATVLVAPLYLWLVALGTRLTVREDPTLLRRAWRR